VAWKMCVLPSGEQVANRGLIGWKADPTTDFP